MRIHKRIIREVGDGDTFERAASSVFVFVLCSLNVFVAVSTKALSKENIK